MAKYEWARNMTKAAHKIIAVIKETGLTPEQTELLLHGVTNAVQKASGERPVDYDVPFDMWEFCFNGYVPSDEERAAADCAV